jgi:uncharacterized membrane protein
MLAVFDTYTVVKFFHVLLAIIAVGFNASYGIWVSRAAKESEHELHVLRGVKILDDRFANPAYAVLLLTGLWMVRLGGYRLFDTFWLYTSLGIYIVTALTAILVYTPTLKKQIALLEAGQRATPQYARVEKRGSVVGILLGVFVVGIVFLMVTKPVP